jgi:flagellar hook assembly protein FlgD
MVGQPEFLHQVTAGFLKAPSEFSLQQNFPNPFNPETSIKFQIPEYQQVSLKIYDILGRQVRILLDNQTMEAGYFEITWDGTNDSRRPVASGIYLLQLKSNRFSRTIKMILQK